MLSTALVGDGVENPANAAALTEAAEMFGVDCRFRDTRGLAGHRPDLSTVDTSELLGGPVVAIENAPGAESVYRAAPVRRPGAAIVVGNERRGVRPDVLRAARTVQIPMPGRGVNTLNVATAAAVGLYYLLGAAAGKRSGPFTGGRPAVLFAAPGDHVEAGSSLRSAAAFGWEVVAVDDREQVWFGTPRPLRAEGRAAARSHRNPLRVVPAPDGPGPAHARIVVCSADADGAPLHRVDLTGAATALVIPDAAWRPPDRRTVEFARVEVPGASRRYRLVTGIVLAETARQLGGGAARRGKAPRRGLAYDSAPALTGPAGADLVAPWDLERY